jgi:hypothetical protein
MKNNCYRSYLEMERLNKYIERLKHINSSKCCDSESCKILVDDINELTKECSEIYGNNGDMCRDLNALATEIWNKSVMLGGKKTRHNNKRKLKKRNNKRKKSRKNVL